MLFISESIQKLSTNHLEKNLKLFQKQENPLSRRIYLASLNKFHLDLFSQTVFRKLFCQELFFRI